MKLLKRLLLTAAGLALAGTSHADARPRLLHRPACQPAPQPTGQYALAAPPVVLHPTAIPPSLFRGTDGLQRIPAPAVPVPALPPAPCNAIQAHANAMASSGRLFHTGRFLPGATREGVGFSSASAEDAVRNCCFHGQYPTVGVTVARGANGWYAVQQYGDGASRPFAQAVAQAVGQVAYSVAAVPGAAVQGVGQFFAGPRTCGPNGCR